MDEEHKDNETTATEATEQTSGQVMDVTAPSKQIDVSDTSSEQEQEAATDNESPQVVDAPPEIADSPEVTSTEPTETTESATTNINVNDVALSDESTPVASTPEPADQVPPADAHQQTDAPHKPAGNGAPIVAIIIAIVVAIAVAGLVIFTYLKSKNEDTIKRSDSVSTNQTVVDKPQASATDVDTTNQQIDSSLEQVDDKKDFPDTELNDTTLGL